MIRNIYVIDTSSLLGIKPEKYPFDIFTGMWKDLEKLVKDGRIISPKLVLEELEKRDDSMYKWAKENEKIFKEITPEQSKLVGQILKYDNFSALIDPDAKEGQADPFIIAMALEKEQQHLSFNEEIKKIVVTEETSDKYLFTWEDNDGIRKFLKNKLKQEWVKDAKIRKTNDNIIITKNENKITLKLNNEENKANLEIYDGKSYNYEYFFKKNVNGKIDIYNKSNKIKISFVCQHFKIECINIFDLFRKEKWVW